MDLSVPPFNLQMPQGYNLSTGSSASPAGTTTSGSATPATGPTSGTVDVVRISGSADAGSFSAIAGDTFRMSGLFHGAAPSGQSVAGYRVALGSGGGQLLLGDVDVSTRTSFTADEFSHLTYKAGAQDTQQTLVVAAQIGKRLTDGTLTQVTDSQAVQITANVTGTRSINAMSALTTPDKGSDTDTAALVSEASILTGIGTGRPTLTTDGNFTTVAGDTYRMGDLFHAAAPTGQAIAGYRVALGDGGGQLLLGGVDVSTRTSFTADEFSHLTYKAGDQDTQQSLVVAAQTGKRLADGTLTKVTDSQAMQITANVTGTRSINAMSALTTADKGSDADIAALVSEAGILTGVGTGRPTLGTTGNFTTVAGDTYRFSDLFHGTAPTGQSIAGYRVALGAGGGQLLLNGVDVSARTSFTADEFSHLSYKAGDQGSQQSLVVAAQTGKRLADGTLTQVIDSQAVQITASVTGTRSINAISALTVANKGIDANIASLVSEAGILTGVGTSRPTLTTSGNFTSVAGDTYRMGDLFHGAAPTGQAIAGYRVALGSGDGQLLLNGVDVSTRTSFTADEFSHLSYKAGDQDSQQSLVVAAQIGKRLTDGTLTKVTDSQALQITANVTGTRSINAMKALTTADKGTDAGIATLVSEAAILTGVGTARPTLSTDGNFTTVAGDTYRFGNLFRGAAPTGKSVAGYRVALSAGDGQLLLSGVDVTTRTSFTADEFSHLSYKAGSDGTQQNLTVAAQIGKRLSDGTLTQVTDSLAVQITASVTGTRSINAMNALTTADKGSDANVAALVSEAGILTGVGTGRPTLQTLTAPDPSIDPGSLATSIGAYNSAGGSIPAAPVDLSSFSSAATGGSVTASVFADPSAALLNALLLLQGGAPGAFRVAGGANILSQAIKAYNLAT